MADPIALPDPKLTAAAKLSLGGSGVVVVGVEQSSQSGSPGDRGATLAPSAIALGEEFGAVLQRMIEAGEITGKSGEVTLLAIGGDAPLVLCLGWGRADKRTRASVSQASATAIRRLIERSRSQVTFALGLDFDESLHDALVAGTLSGCEGQHLYHSEPAAHVPGEIVFIGVSEASVARGRTIGRAVNEARRLVNEPPTIMDPTEFAKRAATMAEAVGLGCEVWDEKRLAKEKCRAILAVGGGSASPPRLVILKYHGGSDLPFVAIVGKGVTFDSGGLSIKPSDGMVDMKCDMAGAATVVAVMRAIAELRLPCNVIGLCGLAENMISGTSYKLGDVIETRSGKTIEILNTDAEGRVVLADTLDVALEMKPAAIVDLATLTGACMVALGTEVTGLMTNDETLGGQVRTAAEAEGEPIWPLPMFELYDEKVKSKVADIKNVGDGRWGGAITAAKFLEHFVGQTPWVHLDIAGPAFADSPKPYRDAGATGVMVRSLIRWLETRVGDIAGKLASAPEKPKR